MNDYEWIPVVNEVYSTSNYYQYQNESFEHNFTIDYDEEKSIKLLRIEIYDRFYLKEFKLIYLDTGETIEGETLDDKFYFRFLWTPKKGSYKIVSQGGRYKYSIFMLASNMKLTREPICRALSPFDLRISLPIKDHSLYKQVAYRKVGSDEWILAALTTGKVPLDVDPTSAYDIKLKLVLGNLFETEYSPTITTTVHQSWISDLNADLDLLNVTLKFQIQTLVWPKHIEFSFGYKPHGSIEDDWIYDAKRGPVHAFKWKTPHAITWDLEHQLYNQLLDEDMAIDLQLIVKNTQTNQVAASPVKKLDLHKRHKILRGEPLKCSSIHVSNTDMGLLFLCKDGQFWFRSYKKIAPKQFYVRSFKGNFILQRKNHYEERFDITLFPIFKKFGNRNGILMDRLSLTLLPELVTIIFKFLFEPSELNRTTLQHLVSLNLVCKYWYNMLSEGWLQMTGELLQGSGRLFVERLGFSCWINFR